MKMIKESIGQLVQQAPDSSVYISFFGDKVSSSELISRENMADFEDRFNERSDRKMLYSALFAKLREFDTTYNAKEEEIVAEDGYVKHPAIARRAAENQDKNILFVFTEGLKSPDYDE